MPSAASILARRRGGDVLIADVPVPVTLRWTGDVRSSDGETLDVAWSASVVPVDSAADRELLAERFLADGHDLTAGRLAAALAASAAPAVTRRCATVAAEALLAGIDDGALAATIERQVRAATFAAGLAIVPPFALAVRSPSLEQAHRTRATRERLAELEAAGDARARSLSTVTAALADAAGDPERARRAIAALRLHDANDLLRAAALVDPAWSSPTPELWLAGGTSLTPVDPTRGTVDASRSVDLGAALGPLRSVRRATIDGQDVLLVGARDGVHVVTLAAPVALVRSLRHATGGEFGFNAACYLTAERTVVATHSQAGVVAWRLDASGEGKDDGAIVVAPVAGGARSIVARQPHRASLVIDGRLAHVTLDDGIELTDRPARAIADDAIGGDGGNGLVTFDDGGRVCVDDGAGEPRCVDIRGAIESIAELEVAGMRRLVVALAAGGLRIVDVDAGTVHPLGPPSHAARLVAARPGFVATLGADRTRVHLIDLARPDAVAAELNVAATLGHRVADLTFA